MGIQCVCVCAFSVQSGCIPRTGNLLFFFYQAVLSLLSTRWPYFFDISHYVAAFSPQEIYDEIPPFFFLVMIHVIKISWC